MHPYEKVLGLIGFPEGLKHTLASQQLDHKDEADKPEVYREILDGAYNLTSEQKVSTLVQMLREGSIHYTVLEQLAESEKERNSELYKRLMEALEIFNKGK